MLDKIYTWIPIIGVDLVGKKEYFERTRPPVFYVSAMLLGIPF